MAEHEERYRTLVELSPGLLAPLGMDLVPRVAPEVLARTRLDRFYRLQWSEPRTTAPPDGLVSGIGIVGGAGAVGARLP